MGQGEVLIRRLVEEATRLAVPSIIVDSANDLARMGDPWPIEPEGWHQGDSAKALDYHQRAEVVVWTPGRTMGNPLTLRPLPDLSAVADNPDEVESAIAMALESLQEIVAPGTTVTARSKRGVLAASLRYFARRGENSIDQLVRLLADLPEEAGAEITDAPKLARHMADALRAQIQVDVLLRQAGPKLDTGLLFGKTGPGTKTRVSVINFIGLPGLEMQQRFLNQLAMTLFTWVRTNPAPEATTLTGLLVVDEAKDFLPSARSSACKASLMRLTAQARKYGLGIIFATQSPKDIDHTVIQNCATHFYGQASSPRAIEVVAEQIRLRGGNANDVPRMGTGRFYVYSAQHLEPPTKVLVPICLSHHPSSPLTETEVLDRARRSRPKAGKCRKSAGASPEPTLSTSRAGSE